VASPLFHSVQIMIVLLGQVRHTQTGGQRQETLQNLPGRFSRFVRHRFDLNLDTSVFGQSQGRQQSQDAILVNSRCGSAHLSSSPFNPKPKRTICSHVVEYTISGWHSQRTFLKRAEHACVLYQRGLLNLSGAARYANVGVEPMMRALTRRGVEHSPSVEQFADGLETLADLFGKDELRAAAAETRKLEGSEFV